MSFRMPVFQVPRTCQPSSHSFLSFIVDEFLVSDFSLLSYPLLWVSITGNSTKLIIQLLQCFLSSFVSPSNLSAQGAWMPLVPAVFPRLVSSSIQHHYLCHQLMCWALFMVSILLCTVPCWKTVCLSYHVKEWLLSHGCSAPVTLENQWAHHPVPKWKVPSVLQLGGETKMIRQWQCLKEARWSEE